jgi:OOP family OmpA-OmpF porin
VRAAIEPPGGVELRLDGTALTLSGSAPASWIRGLAVRLARVEGLGGCDGGALAPVELGRARALAEGLAGREIRFGESVNPLPGAGEALDLAAAAIAELAGLDTAAGLKARVAVVGHSDGLGSEPWNQWLRRERAELIRRLLIERGAPAALLHAEPAPGFEPAAAPRPAERRVGLKVEIESPDPIPCWAG